MRNSFEMARYGGWPNCYRLTNGNIELIITSDVGPRVIRFGFVGERNEFKEYQEQLGTTGGEEWRVYGGHRLWRAPEDPSSTYIADNSPVLVEARGEAVHTVQLEPATSLQKEMEIRLLGDEASVDVLHRLRNHSAEVMEVAPWAVSVMAAGGTGIVPLPPRGSHDDSLLPTSRVALWPYTDMTDTRWTLGRDRVLLRQDADAGTPQKAGFTVPDGWAGYWRGGNLFVKSFAVVEAAVYPDLGCHAEMFTNNEMLELETLGRLTRLEPQGSVEHLERWFLLRGVPLDGAVEAAQQALGMPRH